MSGRSDPVATTDTLTTVHVEGDVPTVVARIRGALDRLGVTVFATIDHAAGARAAGLELPDEVVLVFGDPAVGTALMQADPRVGLDLPLRVLVWDHDGRTAVGYRDPRDLPIEHAPESVHVVLDGMRGLLARLARVAAA
jgi:uncharacterized protein (DUF302 family)